MLQKVPEATHVCIHARLLCFSHVRLFATLWAVAYQAPLSLGFSRPEYWRGLHALLQGILLTQGSNPHFLRLLHWQAGSPPSATKKPPSYHRSACSTHLPGPCAGMRGLDTQPAEISYLLPANTTRTVLILGVSGGGIFPRPGPLCCPFPRARVLSAVVCGALD